MTNINSDLEKLKIEMNKCFDIYKTVEQFNYKFTKDDLNKRWKGNPYLITPSFRKPERNPRISRIALKIPRKIES